MLSEQIIKIFLLLWSGISHSLKHWVPKRRSVSKIAIKSRIRICLVGIKMCFCHLQHIFAENECIDVVHSEIEVVESHLDICAIHRFLIA